MLIHKERLSGSTASGALTLVTKKFSGVLCNLIYVNPATATTTYNLTLVDRDGDTVYSEIGIQGRLLTELNIPLVGSCELRITGASADEAFTAYLGVRESA